MTTLLNLGAGGILFAGIFFYIKVWVPEQRRHDEQTTSWIDRLEHRIEEVESELTEQRVRYETELRERDKMIDNYRRAHLKDQRRIARLERALIDANIPLPPEDAG